MCAIAMDSSEAYCRGKSYSGELGNGEMESSTTDMTLVQGGYTWSDISVGTTHVCAITDAKELYCWGDNQYGQLGIGNTVSSPAPVKVDGKWSTVSAGTDHTCGVQADGKGYCWGRNDFFQSSPSSSSEERTPVQLQGTWKYLSAGSSFTLGIDSKGKGYGWGLSESISSDSAFGGLLGDGKQTCFDPETKEYCKFDTSYQDYSFGGFAAYEQNPVPISGQKKWKTLSAGMVPCGVESGSDKLYCWGYTDGEALVDGSPNSSSPKSVDNKKWDAVSGGLSGARCGIVNDGKAYCWGRNVYECYKSCPLGDGSLKNSGTPKQVSTVDSFQSNQIPGEPMPQPQPEPLPEPQPEPLPEPQPEPEPQPLPFPSPIPEPVPEPEQEPPPEPIPVPSVLPNPVQETPVLPPVPSVPDISPFLPPVSPPIEVMAPVPIAAAPVEMTPAPVPDAEVFKPNIVPNTAPAPLPDSEIVQTDSTSSGKLSSMCSVLFLIAAGLGMLL